MNYIDEMDQSDERFNEQSWQHRRGYVVKTDKYGRKIMVKQAHPLIRLFFAPLRALMSLFK